MSTLAVVEGILRQAEVPMSVREIVERAGEALPTKSKTPDTVVARDLSMDIKKKGDGSMFIRTAPGRYAVREIHLSRLADKPSVTAPNMASMVTSAIGQERAGTRGPVPTDSESSASA